LSQGICASRREGGPSPAVIYDLSIDPHICSDRYGPVQHPFCEYLGIALSLGREDIESGSSVSLFDLNIGARPSEHDCVLQAQPGSLSHKFESARTVTKAFEPDIQSLPPQPRDGLENHRLAFIAIQVTDAHEPDWSY
jgi:hypothetical protein